jgi:hypothetical protein
MAPVAPVCSEDARMRRKVVPPEHPIPDWSTVEPASIAISVVADLLVFRYQIGTLRSPAASAAIGAALSVAELTCHRSTSPP